jgi:FkbM family methyltransferase
MPSNNALWRPLRQSLLRLYQLVFVRPCWQPLNRLFYLLGLHGLGMLNYQDDRVSGERALLHRLLPRLREGATVLDVGAHFGHYASAVKKLCPGAKVFAFEPNPTTFKRTEENARQFGFTAVNKGCSDKPGRLQLYDQYNNTASAHASLFKEVFDDVHHFPCVAMDVEVVDLNSFAREQKLDRIDLLKIDAEGCEIPILKGASELLATERIDAIQFEFGEVNVVSRAFFRDFVRTLPGFRFYRLLCGGLLPLDPYEPHFCEIFAHQNVIAFREKSGVLQSLGL